MTIAPSQTAYGPNLSDPSFPTDGTLRNQNQMFQPRIGFAWDVRGNGKSALRASWGIFNARQNMLTQVGAITTNGVQQLALVAGSCLSGPPGCFFRSSAGGDPPTYPGILEPGNATLPIAGADVTVFSRDYANPRVYSTNVGFDQKLIGDYTAYLDF